MGENVTLGGAREADVCIGDTWQWGSAIVQVTAPRGPCFKLGIRIGRQAARKIIREEGLVGWYLRVLTPGVVPTEGSITLIERHPAGVTVEVAHRALQDRHAVYPDLADLEVMSTNLRAALMWRGRDTTGGVPEEDTPERPREDSGPLAYRLGRASVPSGTSPSRTRDDRSGRPTSRALSFQSACATSSRRANSDGSGQVTRARRSAA